MTEALGKLQKLLKELFQIKNAEWLDFGIYRIIIQKRSQVTTKVSMNHDTVENDSTPKAATSRSSAKRTTMRCCGKPQTSNRDQP